ncbi:MAG TPA: DNA mismatch endonuclease Vsr [Acidobacteriaceae bacterium]|jgi:DNA mismatch endonuclease (patch repair protein)|nr:DNA mismatch endonuclease Vsr [Acidobacteriaceae bacterium]
MTDVHTPERRSRNMASIRGKNTKPEKAVRSLLHKLGYRYRLHRRDLPGKPDLVFPSRRKVIFVHGCFWHMHDCRWGRVVPATNSNFWQEKRQKNRDRDSRTMAALTEIGWRVLVVWECQIKDTNSLTKKLRSFLS